MFWFPYIIYTYYIKKRTFIDKSLIKLLIISIITAVIIASPILIKILFLSTDMQGIDIFPNLGVVNRYSGFLFNDWGILISYIVPIIAIFAVIIAYCADYYELFYKFTPVFIMIAVEIIILNLHMILGSSLQPYLFSIRIGNFFSRYLYFVPIIYFFSITTKNIPHYHSKNKITLILHDFFEKYINKNRIIIAVLGITAVSFLVSASSFKYYFNYIHNTYPRMQIVEKRSNNLLKANKDKGNVISFDMPVNLFISMRQNNASFFSKFV
ncbi:hypothetical protein ACFL4O_00975 [bacterium]